ncbi:MAG: hypothetical protein K0S09_865 [Sphingobacteriaceae bacterium]|jgi:gliding motility-associated-like protein|nr:hypothetical protein [Sphingobacteriaceae bacterium]
MKRLFLLTGLVFSAFAMNGQTVYFSQDFNSSTNYTTYQGSPVTANKFDAIQLAGNTTVNATNNKLQFVKNGGTGVNRGSFTRTTNFAGAPATGPGFLKYSMDVSVSNNSADVASGFRFMFGDTFPITPAAPANGNIHSGLYINPTKNAGEFKVESESNTQTLPNTFTGTQTVIWYINNTGADAGYKAPDGTINTVQDDYADVWVVSGNTKTLVFNEEPALTPAKTLKNFKLTNNPNFTATIDIDNIVISEEPVIVVPKIVSVAPVAPVTVPLKTLFNLLPFPTEVEVTYNNNTKDIAKITYSPLTNYNQYLLGTYQVVGTITPNNGTINPSKISVATTVTVRDNIVLTNTFSPNGDGKNDTWINEELARYQNTSVEVYDRDGRRLFQSTDPKIGWDGKNANGDVIAGSYFYIIKVPDLSMAKRGVVTVIK